MRLNAVSYTHLAVSSDKKGDDDFEDFFTGRDDKSDNEDFGNETPVPRHREINTSPEAKPYSYNLERMRAVSSPQTKAPAPRRSSRSKSKPESKMFLPSRPYSLACRMAVSSRLTAMVHRCLVYQIHYS